MGTSGGIEKQNCHQLDLLLSFIFQPRDDWTFFSGLFLRNQFISCGVTDRITFDFNHKLDHRYDHIDFTESRVYKKSFSKNVDFRQWMVSIPFGLRAKLTKGLFLILGSDVSLVSSDLDIYIQALLPEDLYICSRIDEVDKKTNTHHENSVKPQKILQKVLDYYTGLAYQLARNFTI